MKRSPYLVIMLSFILIIFCGSLLLMLPISQTVNNKLNFIDALFTSTSAVTITGLSPVSNLADSLTIFGKIVLMLLIQIGGLSVVTISVFVMYLIGAKIGISNRVLIKETLNQNSLSGMVKLVVRIVIFTLTIELIGFIINLVVFLPDYNALDAIELSLFHSISSFNNAGFDLLGSQSLQEYSQNFLLNINTMVLIILGGLGFIVINDILEKRKFKKLMIHSKIVIIINAILWFGGMLFFKISEMNNDLSWLEVSFLSVTARTAGFTTINMGNISSLTTLGLMCLMFIGASPSSTGGGIKTTTSYILLKSVTSYARGKQVTTHKRLIADETKYKALVLLTVALLVVIIASGLLLALEPISFDSALFEVVSAFSNTGFSKNLTPSLSESTKFILCFVMFIGRVGPLTVLNSMNRKWYKGEFYTIGYIEEKIMIG